MESVLQGITSLLQTIPGIRSPSGILQLHDNVFNPHKGWVE